MTQDFITKSEFNKLIRVTIVGGLGGFLFNLFAVIIYYFIWFLEPLNYKYFVLFYAGLGSAVWGFSLLCNLNVLYNVWVRNVIKEMNRKEESIAEK